MREKIIDRMEEAAEDKGVIPIAGRERGSRMIGVEHGGSDWDAFLLFAQPAEKYATLTGYTDTLSRKFDGGDIDVHGWNVKKFAKLAADSNPNATEMLMSDEQYFVASDEIDRLLNECESEMRENFNHMALYHHYLSLAESNYQKYIASGNDCTSNRQFYIARATAMATFIREEGEFPPLNVWEFLDTQTCLSDEYRSRLEGLSIKKQAGNLGEHPDRVGEMLERELDADMETTDERINQPDMELLNDLITQSVTR